MEEGVVRLLFGLQQLQDDYGAPVEDVAVESPKAALTSLRDAVGQAPSAYRDYLSESVACYEGGQYRAAILTTWAATVQHLYIVVEGHSGGVPEFEKANKQRFGSARSYRRIRRVNDFLYLRESDFLQLGEDAGLYNRNARKLLTERLDLRNRCAHPTRYKPGREETVVFIESLLLNVIGGRTQLVV